MTPGLEAEGVKEALDSELSSLLVQEARPLVTTTRRRQSAGLRGGCGLRSPPLELLGIKRGGHLLHDNGGWYTIVADGLAGAILRARLVGRRAGGHLR